MACSCIRKEDTKFKFRLETLDCETLLFTDLSSWMEEEGYEVPKTYEMTVVTPINDKGITVFFNPKSTTVLKGSDFMVSQCIPDGVYCFTVNSCGNLFTRHAAITCTLNCRLDTLISQAKEKGDFDKVSEIKNYIESVKVNASQGKSKKAAEMFDIAKKELDNLNCNC